MSDIIGCGFPVLSNSSLDYMVEDKEESKNFEFIFKAKDELDGEGMEYDFEYKLVGNNLVSDLIKSDRAYFSCMVSLPSTLYRETFTCAPADYVEIDKTISFRHKILISGSFSQNESPRFLPLVIYTKNEFKKEKSENNPKWKLHPLWHDKEFFFQEGDIIARGEWQQFQTKAIKIITFRKDSNLPPNGGTIGEARVVEHDGGSFIAYLSEDLFEALKRPSLQGNSITTHVLAKCLRELKKKYDGVQIDDLANLKSLVAQLQAKVDEFGEDLDFRGEDFDEDKAACALLPHRIQFDDEE